MKLSDYQQTTKGLVRKDGQRVYSVHSPEGHAALRQLAKRTRKERV